MPDEIRPRRAAAATFLFCLCSAAVMAWPVVRDPAGSIPMDVGDPVLNAAILHWNATTVPLTREWWNFPIFAPAENVTTFTEHLLGMWPIAWPVSLLTGNPLLAYNTAFLLTFPLSGLTMFLLVRRLTASPIAGFVAGVAFAFTPFRAGQLSHLQMLMTWGIPLALLGLHGYVETGARVGLLLFALGWAATVLSNGYMLVFFGVYVACWVLWFCSTREGIRRAPGIAAAGLAASAPLAPILWKYAVVHEQYGFSRALFEVVHFSADLDAVLHPWARATVSALWLEPRLSEAALFPGVATVALAAAGLFAGRTSWGTPPLPRFARLALAGTAVAFLAAAALAAVADVRYTLAGVRISITDVGKPLAIGTAALVAHLGTHPSLRPAVAARSPVLFYALMVVFTWVLSLGPEARLNGATLIRDLPYTWLLALPGVDGLRVPARFWMLGVMSLAVLAGFGTALLIRRIPRATAVAAAVAVLMLAEGWAAIDAAPIDPHPPVRPVTADAPVLELPMDRVDLNTPAMLRAVTGGYRTLNGYSGYEPPHFAPLSAGLAARDGSVVTELRRRMPLHISVHADDRDGLRTWLTRAHDDAELVAEGGGRALFYLTPMSSDAAGPERELAFRAVASSCGDRYLPDIRDGSLETRWECGPATKRQYIELELEAPAPVSTIVNVLGPFKTDAPRRLRVEVSNDRENWVVARESGTAAASLRAAFDAPRTMPLTFRFPAVEGRYVRLTQTGDETQWHWSIAELRILSPS